MNPLTGINPYQPRPLGFASSASSMSASFSSAVGETEMEELELPQKSTTSSIEVPPIDFEEFLLLPEEMHRVIASFLDDTRSLCNLSQINRYFHKIFAAKVAAAQPLELTDEFYDGSSWLNLLLIEYTQSQPTLSAEDLHSSIKSITQAMLDVVYIYSKFPQIVFDSLAQVVDPLFKNEEYKTKIYDVLHNTGVDEKRPYLSKYAKGLWALRRIFAQDKTFVESLYPQGSPKSEDNYRCLQSIVFKHVYTVMRMIAKKIKIVHNKKLEFLAGLDLNGKAIAKINCSWNFPNGASDLNFSIGNPDPHYHPLKFQLACLKQEKQGTINADKMEKIDNIIGCASENHISSLGSMFLGVFNDTLEEKPEDEAIEIKTICRSIPRKVEILRESSIQFQRGYLAIDEGDGRFRAAQFTLGEVYSLGIGSEKELAKARQCYQRSAQAEHPSAQYKEGVAKRFECSRIEK